MKFYPNIIRIAAYTYAILTVATGVCVIWIGLYFPPLQIKLLSQFTPSDEYIAETLFENPAIGVDVQIRSIPQHRVRRDVWVSKASARYDHSILQGQGNCSNFAYALAAILNRQNIDYLIVYSTTHRGVFSGIGHTGIYMNFSLDNSNIKGIIDPYSGGLVLNASHGTATINDLLKNNFNNNTGYLLDFKSMLVVESGDYWAGNHNELVYFASSKDVDQYFAFVDILPSIATESNSRFSRLLVDGTALLFGKLPKLYVNSASYARLMSTSDGLNVSWLVRIFPELLRVFLLSVLFAPLPFWLTKIFRYRTQNDVSRGGLESR